MVLFSYSLTIAIVSRLHCLIVDGKAWWEGMEMIKIFVYRTVAVMHFTNQNWISKIVYCVRCVMVCKIGFTDWNAKIALLRASMVVTYYIKHFRKSADRRNGILMSLLLLVAETIIRTPKTTCFGNTTSIVKLESKLP